MCCMCLLLLTFIWNFFFEVLCVNTKCVREKFVQQYKRKLKKKKRYFVEKLHSALDPAIRVLSALPCGSTRYAHSQDSRAVGGGASSQGMLVLKLIQSGFILPWGLFPKAYLAWGHGDLSLPRDNNRLLWRQVRSGTQLKPSNVCVTRTNLALQMLSIHPKNI